MSRDGFRLVSMANLPLGLVATLNISEAFETIPQRHFDFQNYFQKNFIFFEK